MAAPRPLRIEDVIVLLGHALGEHKARAAVAEAVRTLQTSHGEQVLDALASLPGVVGAAARFASARRRSTHRMPAVVVPKAPAAPAAPPAASAPVTTPAGDASHAAASRPGTTVVSARHVAALLARSLGEEKSTQLVESAIQALGADRDRLDRKAALGVLETLATEPGLVGIASRFAKARVLLLFDNPQGTTG